MSFCIISDAFIPDGIDPLATALVTISQSVTIPNGKSLSKITILPI